MQTQVLDDDTIRRAAPSVFATHGGGNTSQRYAYISSYDVVREMRLADMYPVAIRDGRKRDPSGREFAMHEIRFQRADHMEAVARAGLGGLIPQAIFRNSHDATSALNFEAGLMRVVCLNGMTAPGANYGSFSVRHMGDPSKRRDELHTGMAMIREGMLRVLDTADAWRKIELSVSAKERFVQRALETRGTTLAIDPFALLQPRRHNDVGDDLWSVFNRVQENLTKGGVRGRTATGRRSSLRSIGTLRADVDFNRGIWEAASELAADVTGASSVVALT